jgi:uncharacterized protein YegP (UPF0339 family)
MAGYFELVDAPDGGYRVKLIDGTGNLMAISVTFPSKRAAAAGVAKAREIAGTGLIRDLRVSQDSEPLKQPEVGLHIKAPKKLCVLGSGRPRVATGHKRTRTHL